MKDRAMNATMAFMRGVGDAPMLSGAVDLDLLNALLGSEVHKTPAEQDQTAEEEWPEHSHKPAFKNDPPDPDNPNEVRERTRRKVSESQ
jgi:hypothetical protein